MGLITCQNTNDFNCYEIQTDDPQLDRKITQPNLITVALSGIIYQGG